jgi:hypothetical protein
MLVLLLYKTLDIARMVLVTSVVGITPKIVSVKRLSAARRGLSRTNRPLSTLRGTCVDNQKFLRKRLDFSAKQSGSVPQSGSRGRSRQARLLSLRIP